jgi:hypothetical protein
LWRLPLVVSLAPLQAQDTAAKALVINGDVSVLRDGGPWALFEGNTVRPQQMVKTGPDGYARFQVSDGSTFEVFPNSQVVFRANPPSWKDLLDVVIGRVKVYIQHLPGIPNPNNVSSPTAVISVRGTVFEVNVEDEDGTTFVSVDEGLVAVRSKAPAGGEVLLQPTESIRVFKNQPLAQKMDKSGIARAIRKGPPGRRPRGAAAPGRGRGRRGRHHADHFHGNRPAGRQGQRRHDPHRSGAAIGASASAARRVVSSSAGAAACSPRRKPWESARKRFSPGRA